MPRYIRNTVILIKNETTAGTDPTPTGAANAMLIKEMTITPLDAKNIDRANIKGYFGGDSQLIGPASVKVSLTVELSGSSVADTPPMWGAPLLSCAMAESILATPARVEYLPVSTTLKTSTIYYYDDGVLHKLHYCMGSVSLSAKVGEIPCLKFEFTGLDGGTTAAANATPTLTAWKVPVPMTKANVVDITLGLTYATGAFSSGTAYPSTGLEINWGNVVNFTPNLTAETVDITDRQASGSVELELTAAQEVTFMTAVKANTLQTMGITIGTTTGYKILVYMPSTQLINPKKVDINGKRYCGYDIRLMPSSAGNDEIRLIHV